MKMVGGFSMRKLRKLEKERMEWSTRLVTVLRMRLSLWKRFVWSRKMRVFLALLFEKFPFWKKCSMATLSGLIWIFPFSISGFFIYFFAYYLCKLLRNFLENEVGIQLLICKFEGFGGESMRIGNLQFRTFCICLHKLLWNWLENVVGKSMGIDLWKWDKNV